MAAAGWSEEVGEVFDSLSYYFPISFTPPPGDSHGITRAHLLTSLIRTLRASPRFAPLALPFLARKGCAETHAQ